MAKSPVSQKNPEQQRLADDEKRLANWKRWGPYLSERQWGTVREDYSADGESWNYFTHEEAQSRAYRWGEDGLLGFSDRQGRLCFSVALWNGRDAFLKERLFGLTGKEGNHGEDVKECYFYLDATPTYSYAKALYKYPQRAFPYEQLREENRRRGRGEPEFELSDTGVFDDNRYFDLTAEYAKDSPEDICIRLTVANRGPEEAVLHLLPTLWFRNSWSWGRTGSEDGDEKPQLKKISPGSVLAHHVTLGEMILDVEAMAGARAPELLFTENETNAERLFQSPNESPFVKDAFHRHVVDGERDAVNPAGEGTKMAAHHELRVGAGQEQVVRLRLRAKPKGNGGPAFGKAFEAVFAERKAEADLFYARSWERAHHEPDDDERIIARQACAGLLWSKQFYHYVVKQWLQGDPSQPAPPVGHVHGRNREWTHIFIRDVLSMPDKWEYPWFAAWDLAFHMIPFARIDPEFAKEQLKLLLREWYMHPNGQIPAYEWNFSDVNPPVHAWACWRVYKITGRKGRRDRDFLARTFQKLLINFTWWVNRKDPDGRNLFSGGFLGLDNIGVFDRSKPLPGGAQLEQADATAWMAFYCGTMLSMALELASEDPVYEDIASKFFEHFISIVDAMNTLGGTGLWNEEDGFYYDQLLVNGASQPVRLRSIVGIIPLFAVELLEIEHIKKLPGFEKRARWFVEHRPDLAAQISYFEESEDGGQILLAVPSKERLERVLRYVFDEKEFLSPHGIRSLSRYYKDRPFSMHMGGEQGEVSYVPGDANTGLFGGNSNWRGPIWMPVNFLLIEALERYHKFYGDSFTMEFPTGSGVRMTLGAIAQNLSERLVSLFRANGDGRRPSMGMDWRYINDPHWQDLVLFHEYFHGDTGEGLGASHQTGWTALAVTLMERPGRSV